MPHHRLCPLVSVMSTKANILQKNTCVVLLNPLSANFTKWSNTLKQFVSNLPKNCLSVFEHFLKLALKRLRRYYTPKCTKQLAGLVFQIYILCCVGRCTEIALKMYLSKIVSLFLHVIAIYGLLELLARQEITTCCVSTWLT